MQYLFSLMIVEMLCVNLYVSHICLDRKAAPIIVVPVMVLFTGALLGVSTVAISNLPGYGYGRFVFLGFFYLIPLVFLYRRGIKTTVSVMCLSWSYTMLVFLFAKYLGQFFPESMQASAALVIQTVTYLCTLHFFLHMLHEKLLYVIVHADPYKGDMLFRLSVSTCAVAFCANWVLLQENSLMAKLALVCTLAVNTTMMYQALYDLTKAQRHAVQTRKESLTDALTGLNNRRAFFEQAEQLVEQGRPFSIAFIDLDRFKSINDTYGHMTGDWYLKHFTQEFIRHFSDEGALYRIAGDEFVYLREEEPGAEAVLKSVCSLSISPLAPDIPFLGFSCGGGSFPADAKTADELLAVADSRMYQAKMKARAVAENTV